MNEQHDKSERADVLARRAGAAEYDVMADALCEVADAARGAFIKAGFDPGEWDGDDIVEDVKRGLVMAIEQLAERRRTAPELQRIDRGDAVNLAHDLINSGKSLELVTATGIACLADAVLRMDAALKSGKDAVDPFEFLRRQETVVSLPIFVH